ncbi:MAG TPA: orotate phosphoribosyltransferase [Bacteriovoracaceae bacterium]|nr:orotate phosphoribosyltransferase [Bacteriovoracaceae bacterium]
MNVAQSIASILLNEKAVFLRPDDPFTWTSGIKSPVYCDNRLLISSVSARETIVKAFCEILRHKSLDLISGTATAGIPWAAWIAMELRLPLVYVRGSGKSHGRQNAIEGRTQPGMRTVLIEDLISTGKSSIEATGKLEAAGVKVESVLSIFSYDFPFARKVFEEARISVAYLSTFEVLAKVAYDDKLLDAQALASVLEWRKTVELT